MFDHTRHFYPTSFGHGIKINHFFPTKDYGYHDHSKTESEIQENENKPVKEKQETDKHENNQMVFVNGKQMLVLKPVKAEESVKEMAPIVKTDVVENSPVKMMPALVTMIMKEASSKMNAEAAPVPPEIEKTETPTASENETNEHHESHKEEPSDSDVASSYYHSRVYYVGF